MLGVVDLFIRRAVPDDVTTLHRFVIELAAAEDFPCTVEATPDDLAEALFGTRPVAEAIVATIDGEPAGFALYYLAYSTILGRPTLHLEDLYVSPAARNNGLGVALFQHLSAEAVARGCGRFEWWVLHQRRRDPLLPPSGRTNSRRDPGDAPRRRGTQASRQRPVT
ncbi:hypothetical protein GCM10009854_04150 [Saccharopolyspora halophila]|uniref:N-acetyltransferase domain-containing protein n=1 Tax=Saccharopolyspora halophila TaxID=405551 RepID=A0ABN3FK84_9PSEU